MHPFTPIAALLLAATTALPVPQGAVNDPLLDNLPDTILDSVSSLLGYPKKPVKDDKANAFKCAYDPAFCVGDCVKVCIGGAQACSKCLMECSAKKDCRDDDDDEKDDDRDDSRQAEDEDDSDDRKGDRRPSSSSSARRN
ncbi:hypothetical protein F4778DRAFT_778599 [Xylariomycetidae sp. FL2044]|nr:hypothetical protein F4778DRAFT_778599 [Xylariomycetidae sp. FL2044]